MSLSWRSEVEVTLGREGAKALPAIDRGARVTVLLSSHHVRYALLPWSANVAGEADWLAYARYRFRESYGSIVDSWEVRVSPSSKGAARVACALDRQLHDEVRDVVSRAGARLVSVKPGLMHAFNRQRRRFRRDSAWLVAAEQGRLVLALIVDGLWELVRVRNVAPAWREQLDAILRQEESLAQRATPVTRVVLA